VDLIDLSVVVLAQGHNPTILHPAFLVAQNIVPANWELATPPITTLPLAMATYSNGIAFSADDSRFIVRDSRPLGGAERFRAAELARSYVNSLPHVNYNAVGINFQVFIAKDQPGQALRNRFLQAGALTNGLQDPEWMNLSLRHTIRDILRTVTFSPAPQELGRTGAIIAVNYHATVGTQNRLENVTALLASAQERWQDFEQIANRLERELQ
jgi:hypothetical protein